MTLDVLLGAKVECTDGAGGSCTRVTLNRATRHVTHLVVRERGLWRTERLVPIGRVRGAAHGLLRLDCSGQELSRMDPLIEIGLMWTDIPELDELHCPVPLYVRRPESMEKQESPPRGELCLSRGARVQATDGKVASLDAISIHPLSGEITHLRACEKRGRKCREMVIPAAEIDHLEEESVYLKLDRNRVESLVPVQAQTERDWQ